MVQSFMGRSMSVKALVKRLFSPDFTRFSHHAPWLWWRFSVRRIFYNPLRVAIVVLSIALATALWSSVTAVSLASVRSFEEGVGVGQQRFDLLAYPVGGRLSLTEAAPCLSALAPTAQTLIIRRESGSLTAGSRTRAVSVAAVAAFPFNQTPEGESTYSIISEGLAAQMKLKEREVVSLSVGDKTIHTEVKRSEQAGSNAQGEFDILIPFADLNIAEGFIDTLAIDLKGDDSTDAISTLAPWLSSCLSAAQLPIRVERIDEPIARSERLLAAYRLNIIIMASITLLVCALLISQATHLALPGVLRELSIVRTLGVSNTVCFLMIVLEGMVLSAVGALVGYTLGYPFIVWMVGFLLTTATDIYHVPLVLGSMGLTPSVALAVALGMIALGTGSAACGARGILTLPPYRGTRREQIHHAPLSASSAKKVAIVGSAVCTVVLLLLLLFRLVFLAYLGVGAVLLWAACCVPFALTVLPRAVARISGGVSKRLALGSLATSGRNFLLSAIAACLAITLMTGLSLMVSSFRETLTRWSESRLVGDLFVSSSIEGDGNQARIEERQIDSMRAIAGVSRVIPYYETLSAIAGKSVVVGGVSLTEQCKRNVYPFIAGGCVEAQATWGERVIISESAARKLSLAVGDALKLDGRKFVIQGVVQEFGTEQPLVVLDEGEFRALYRNHNPKTVTIDLSDKALREPTRNALQLLAPQEFVIRDHKQLLALVETLFNRTFRVTESVRWIVFSIAMLGLVSTCAQHLWERRREFKTLLVLGVPRRTLFGAVAIEAATVTSAALVLGLIAGVLVGWTLTEYINPLVFGWSLTFSLSWVPALEALVFYILVVVGSIGVSVKLFQLIASQVRLADE
jgi:putative ABC transport system permease protein